MGRNDSILSSSSSLRLDRRSGEDCFVRFANRWYSATPSSASLCLFVILNVRAPQKCGQNMLCTVMGDRNVQPLGVTGALVQAAVRPERGTVIHELARLPDRHTRSGGKTCGFQAFNRTRTYTLDQDQQVSSMPTTSHLAICGKFEAGIEAMSLAQARHNGAKHNGYS